MEQALYSLVEVRGIIASGDADSSSYLEGNTDQRSGLFVPISQITKWVAFSPQMGNLLVVEASYSLKPFSRSQTATLDQIQTLAKVAVFMRPIAGADLGFIPGSRFDFAVRGDGSRADREVPAVLRPRPGALPRFVLPESCGVHRGCRRGRDSRAVWSFPSASEVEFDMRGHRT